MPFSEFVSDYYNLNVSANIVAERSVQTEPAILLLNVVQGQNKEPFLVSGTCLFRFGINEKIELRTQINPSTGYYAEIEKPERKNYYIPVCVGAKVALIYSKKHRPVVSIIPDITFYAGEFSARCGAVVDLKYKDIFRFTTYNGVQSDSGIGYVYQYSHGIILKADNSNFGIYCLASNKFPFLDDLLNFGFAVGGKQWQATAGYGVHEDNGMLLFGCSIRTGKQN